MERAELARRLRAGSAETTAARIVIDESDPVRFMRAFAAAVAGAGEIFLANPTWGSAERGQLEALRRHPATPTERGWLMIPTGGTSGVVKFARHDSTTIAAAVAGFSRHFGLERVNALNLLPLYHVSGLMAWLRSALTGGQHIVGDWKDVGEGRFPPLPGGDWVTSLVPTQLGRLLESEDAVTWLRGFRAIFIGGGPAWSELVERARAARLPVAITYGMTETAAMVAGMRPGELPAASTDCGPALPHARIAIDESGAVRIAGESVFRGYFPDRSEARELVTRDAGEIRAGRLHVLGRLDGVIITGGEKVQPLEVEAELRATGEFADVAVVGIPHPQWGQQVVAGYSIARVPNLDRVRRAMRDAVAAYKQPKAYVAVDPWPSQAHGKLNRARLVDAIVRAGQGVEGK